ncbi:MAG TPA: hypothetical protein VFE14_09580, partial [Micromonosporaceae bacterium]|nr:hypothetical protein [Micromonosporaceae bacterium]
MTLLKGMGHIREHESDRWWRSWLVRTTALLVGTLALAGAFIAAYVGGLHDPSPHNVPIAVIRDDSAARQLMAGVRARTDTIKAIEYADAQAADDALLHRKVYAVLASSQVAPAPGLNLTTASGAGPAATEVIEGTLTVAADAAGISLAVADAVPTSTEDSRGLVPFYLVVGLVLGGYLGSTALGVVLGTVPRNLDRAAMRTAALAVYSVLLGIAGAILVGPVLGIWTEHRIGLAIGGSLIAFASAMFAAA